MNYLLHFDAPYPRGHRGSVQHYIGFAKSRRTFKLRIEHHRNGSGARLMAAVSAAGIGFVVARTWDYGDRTHERKLKNRKNARKLCPVCRRRAA